MPKVARLGDISDHGGIIITASTTTFSEGIGVARLGDLHSCPIYGHGITPIITGSPTIKVDGRLSARVGDSVVCGAKILIASPTVTFG